MAAAGSVSRVGAPASPWGRPSEWEDAEALAAGRGPVVRGPSAWGVVAVMVETVFAGRCPSGWWVSVTGECLVELRGAVTMVPEGRTWRDSLGDGSWAANPSASVSATIRRKP